MKVLLGLLLVFFAVGAMGQVPSTLPFRGDTIKIHKVGGFAELVLQNRTKDTTRGIAVNEGNGHLIFKRPYKIDDTTIVIGLDTFVVGTGSGLTSAQVQTLIDASINDLPIHMDEDYFDGDGSIATPYTPKLDVFAFQTDIDDLTARVDSIIGTWPSAAGSRTTITSNSIIGDSVLVKVNDSSYIQKKWINGTNTTVVITDSTIKINATSGTAEVNSIAATLTTADDRTLPGEAILQYILVKPTSTLAGFKAGTGTDDEYYVPATPITATGNYTTIVVNEYVPATDLTIFLDGITSSTDIKLIYKLIHE